MKLKDNPVHVGGLRRDRVQKFFEGESRTKQADGARVDINNIVKRFVPGAERLGVSSVAAVISAVAGGRQLVQGDVSEAGSYQTQLNAIIHAKEAFMELPSGIRKRFDNDPARLLSFVGDDRNYDEAVKLGLLEATKVEARVAGVAARKAAASKPAPDKV